MTILSSVMQFAMLPLQGLTQGGQPIISYNFGANNAERVRKGFRFLLISAVVYAAGIWAVSELAPGVFVTIFTNDPQLAEFAKWAMRIYMAAVVLMGAQIACQQTFIAFGNSKNFCISGNVQKDYCSDPADLYSSGISGGSCTGSISGRADRGCDRSGDNAALVQKEF